MYLLGVLCLLSAAFALPTPDEEHVKLLVFPPPPERKSTESKSSEEQITGLNPIPPPRELPSLLTADENVINNLKSHLSKKSSESVEKPKEEKDEAVDNSGDFQDVRESKESKESKGSKESKEPMDSKESRESKEHKESKESKESKELKEGQKDEIPDESNEDNSEDDDDTPILVEFDKKKSSLSSWLSSFLPHWPFQLPSILRPFRNSGQIQEEPHIYIVKESDFDLD